MKCPFRTKVVREYERVKDVCLPKEEYIEYPDCYENSCPFYSAMDSTTGCKRVDTEIGEDY